MPAYIFRKRRFACLFACQRCRNRSNDALQVSSCAYLCLVVLALSVLIGPSILHLGIPSHLSSTPPFSLHLAPYPLVAPSKSSVSASGSKNKAEKKHRQSGYFKENSQERARRARAHASGVYHNERQFRPSVSLGPTARCRFRRSRPLCVFERCFSVPPNFEIPVFAKGEEVLPLP